MKMNRLMISLLFLGVFYSSETIGKEPDISICETGNFFLPLSQQPGPLVSFGDNIIGQHQTQLLLFGDDYLGKNTHFLDLVPGILYGITNNLSVFFNVPLAASYKIDEHHSSGLEDFFLQLEYAIFTRTAPCFIDQITLVGAISFPTGSSHKNPPTGFGAIGFFIGTTYNCMWENWFCFTSFGANLPMAHHELRFGNQYLYQIGVGRNITNTKRWEFAWMAEMDGTYSSRNKIHGKADPNSGGNVIYLTPSLWASSKEWIIQLGLGFAVQQRLFGHQKRDDYLLVFNVGRTF